MKPKHNVELQKKICLEFGADLDSELCQEVGSLMEECPECRVYYDTMKRSVQLFRVVEDDCDVPDEVSERLFKVLELEKLKKDS
jgi:predicted anti-sigma-YlaC factor YlaD